MSLPATMVGCSPKSYLTADTAERWLDALVDGLQRTPERGEGVFVCLPAALLARGVEMLAPLGVVVGTQDVSAHPVGAFTGEDNAELLAGLGARLAMIGHPERVRYFGETPEVFGAKARAAASAGIAPVLIVGEPERGADPERIIRPQLDAAFGEIAADAPVVVAYEPTWAIGAAEPAPPAHVVGVVARLRELLADRRGPVRVVYGGSAGPGTYAAIAAAGRAAGAPSGIPDGVFLGRAGVDAAGFLATIAEVRST
ncbi:triose-phosphate isomerase [Microbacterium sp. ACRRU]|uniref:triose-phosphate isomerase family protein n=1 Tax=Microbacterium sp. ACRRU TaxID=2918204 RepID=UPI001EF67E41|nr:triose-phosphate isomerase family protein [Microbacterium sp. ACRRU]MCG7417926.1 triose-phosphate isomerase [Microbacterium sp. ACRRU]